MHHCAFHGHAINPDTGKIAEYRELSQCSDGPIWQASNADEIGRLAQGFGAIKGTNTIFFIHPSAMPAGRKATYLRVVSALRPEESQPYRIRWTVGGDKVDYPWRQHQDRISQLQNYSSSVCVHSQRQIPDRRLKGFLPPGTPMSRYEYMRVPI
ncbi:Reverse transcriptase (RNA-dependent DNA polymerase) [Fragilaria crotonensis]|nr:Reverse transcriptase (RNA-dependent DNA polymerase) [Fragilaria crotonensis]